MAFFAGALFDGAAFFVGAFLDATKVPATVTRTSLVGCFTTSFGLGGWSGIGPPNRAGDLVQGDSSARLDLAEELLVGLARWPVAT